MFLIVRYSGHRFQPAGGDYFATTPSVPELATSWSAHLPVLSNHQFVMRREVQLPSPFADPPANKVAGGKPKEQAAVEPVIASTVTRS